MKRILFLATLLVLLSGCGNQTVTSDSENSGYPSLVKEGLFNDIAADLKNICNELASIDSAEKTTEFNEALFNTESASYQDYEKNLKFKELTALMSAFSNYTTGSCNDLDTLVNKCFLKVEEQIDSLGSLNPQTVAFLARLSEEYNLFNLRKTDILQSINPQNPMWTVEFVTIYQKKREEIRTLKMKR